MTRRFLPTDLYSAAEVRAIDHAAIHKLGIAGIDLMERAGASTLAAIRDRWPNARTLSALCGGGSNGGDGYIVARLAHQLGWDVRAYPVSSPDTLKGDARLAFERFHEAGGEHLNFIPEDFEASEILVDALLGTGLDRDVTGKLADVIKAVNRYRERGLKHQTNQRAVVAVDIPSGLNADTGARMGTAIKANLTVTFVGLKRGLLTGEGPELCGKIVFDDLGIDPQARLTARPSAHRLQPYTIPLPIRTRAAHKGLYGHVLVIGGDHGYSGAARLAAEAAARIGAGLVSVATRSAHAALMNLSRPELMCHGVESPADLEPLLERATVVAIGPGLGLAEWGRSLFRGALETDLPLVVDADALNLLAESPHGNDHWVLTPHPGEAGRLLGISSSEVQSDRFAAIKVLQAKYGGVTVLKGAGSLIQADNAITDVCTAGNPGMASGGMGDVLTGVIAGLIAQGLSLDDAARYGVYLHAQAADLAASEDGERGLLAGDLMQPLRILANGAIDSLFPTTGRSDLNDR
jgi:NAD(P)H-hydrate epimerase